MSEQCEHSDRSDGEHQWERVNVDGSREIYKCTKCGELKKE